MKKQIRITVEYIEDGRVVEVNVVAEQAVKPVKSIEDLGFNHQQQMDLLKGCQDGLLKAQSASLKEDISECPRCGSKLKFAGSISSDFYSVFTNHKVSAKRQKCCNKKCGWTSVPSIRSLFTTNSHPDLSKLQAEMACNHTYREAERNMNACSYYPRKVNNRNHIHHVVEIVGNYISNHPTDKIPNDLSPTEELVCQVDGGHLKSREEGKRSFEVLTSCHLFP